MSAANAPFGLRPIYHPSGVIRPRVLALGIASGYATGIFAGAPVKLVTGGTIEIAGVSDPFVGAFIGVQYTPSGGRPIFSNQWPASATYVTTEPMNAFFTDDPDIEYAIQSAGVVAQTAIGDQADFAARVTNGGNTTTGYSNDRISTTLAGAAAQALLRILDLVPGPDNVWGDAFTMVRVQIAEHQYRADRVAF